MLDTEGENFSFPTYWV